MDIGTLTASLMVNTTGLARAQASMTAFQRNLLASWGKTQAQLNAVTSGYAGAEKSARKAGAASKEAGDVAAQGMKKAGTVAASSFGDTSQAIERSIFALRSFGWLATTTLTVPIVAAGKSALNAYKEFEYSMTKIIGLVGIAKNQVEGWSSEIRAMAKNIGFAPNALADALYYVTSSGFKTNEALNIVNQSAKAAAAGLGETKDVADLVTSVMNAYGQGNITAARTLDILVAAVREGKGEASEYAKVLGSVVPFASQLGVKFEEVAGSVAAMTLSGASAANAATYLRNIFMKLLKPAKQSEDALRAMGSSSLELRNILQQRGVLAALMKIRELTDKYGDEMMGRVIPNIRAMLAELMLTGKNFEYNAKVMDLVANSAGSLANAYQVVYNSLQKRMDRLSAQVKDSMIIIGDSIKESVMPILEALGRSLENLSKWFSQLSTQWKTITTVMAGALAVIGPLALIISTLSFAFKGTWSVLKGVGKGFIWLKNIFALNTKGLRNLIAAFGSFAKPIAIALKYVKSFAGAFGPIIAVVGLAYKVLKGYEKGVIEAAKANSVFEKTLVNVNDEVKKIGDVKAQDWAAMDYERLMKWNMWAGKSVANTKEWIKYFYKLAGVSAENATKYTDVLAQGNKASEKDLKEATKNMGRWKDQIGIYQERLNAGLAMLAGTGDALAEKFDEFSKIGKKPAAGQPLNMAFGIREVEQTMEFVDEQLNQVKWLEEAYRKLGVRGYEATSKKVDVLNEALLKLIENGWGASKEARELAKQINALGGLAGEAEKETSKLNNIMTDFGEKSRSLEYMAANANRFGIELDYIAEKTKLVKDTLEKVAETKGLNTKFAQDLIQMLEKMPPNVYGVTQALDSLKKSFSGVDLEVEILGPNVEGTEKKIKILEDTIQDIVKATKEMQNLDTATLGTLGFKDFGLADIKIIDLIKLTLGDLNKQLEQYKSAYTDEEFRKSQALLESQASTYGTLSNQIEVVDREISYLERKLYQASTAMSVNKDEVAKYATQLTNAKTKMLELEAASDIIHYEALHKAFGGLSTEMDLLSSKLELARQRFFLMSELAKMGFPGAQAGLAIATKNLEGFLKESEKLQRTQAIYQTLGNAIADFSFQIGKAFGGAEGSMTAIVDSVLQTGQQVISMLLAEAAAAVLAGETIKGMGLPGLIAGAVGIGILMTIWEGVKSNTQDATKMAKGGIVPEGYPNDTFSALLTSGEIVIPKDKYKDIEPLHTLAKRGSLHYKEFLDAPSSMIMAKKIELPKLQKGGVIPAGYPNDTYPAFLSSGEIVMPKGLLESMATTSSSDSWLEAILNELRKGNEGQKKVDPILVGIEKYQQKALEENRAATKIFEENSTLYSKGTEKYYEIFNAIQDVSGTIKDEGFFKLKDVSKTGGVGVRHGAEINKSVLADLAKAAAKENIPLMTALETAMRETGIGSYMSEGGGKKIRASSGWYNPNEIMQGWDINMSRKAGVPMNYDQFVMNKGLIPKEATYKNKYGYQIDYEKLAQLKGPGAEYEHAGKYYDYIKNFKVDESILEPFRKEMRYLKEHSGQAYNPGEKEREARLAYERNVILKNEDFYQFADSVYRANQQQTDLVAGTKVVPAMTGVMTLLTKLFTKKQTTEKEPGPSVPYTYEAPAGYTGALVNYMKNLEKPKYEGPEFKKLNENVKQQSITNLKVHNYISDIATGIATWGTQLRKPTVEEYEAGRAGGMGRADVLAKSATWGGVDLLTEGFMSKAVPVIANKLSNIPGLTAEAPELGFHKLLSKEHWAWHPGQLMESGAKPKEIALLYAEATANRMMPIIKKTPLITPVRKSAEKVMTYGGGSSRDLNDILNALSRQGEIPLRRPYTGAALGKREGGERNLIKLYLYGEEKGFEEAGEDIIRIPLERYKKLYPEAKSYIMESVIPHGKPLTSANAIFPAEWMEKKGPFSIASEEENIIQPLDDIAGHMVQLVNQGKNRIWVTQDLWKFNPLDYSKRWISEMGGTFGTSEFLPLSLTLEKQSAILDKIGKPFYLIQNNPLAKGINSPIDWGSSYESVSPAKAAWEEMNNVKFDLAPKLAKPSYNLIGIGETASKLKYVEDAISMGNKWSDEWWKHPETQKKINLQIQHEFDLISKRFPEVPDLRPEDTNWGQIKSNIYQEKYIARMANSINEIKELEKINAIGASYTSTAYPIWKNVVHPSVTAVQGMSTAVHEGTHGITGGNEYLPTGLSKTLKSVMYDWEEYENLAIKVGAEFAYGLEDIERVFGNVKKGFKYMRDPAEIYARISQIRHAEGLKPGQKITEEMFGGIMEKGSMGEYTVSPSFFYMIKKPKTLMNLMNKLPAIGGVGVGMGAMTLGGEEAGAQDITKYTDAVSELPTYINASTQATLAEIEAKRNAEIAANALALATEGEAASAEKTGGIFSTLFGGGLPKLGDIGKGMEAALPSMFSGVFSTMLSTFLGPLGGILGGLVSNIFSGVTKMATGGIIPPGYPNDSFPALLTSGEIVIPKDKARIEFLDSPMMKEKLNLPTFDMGTDLPKFARGGSIIGERPANKTTEVGQWYREVPKNYQWQEFADTFQIITLLGGTAFKGLWNLFHKKEKDVDWFPKFGTIDFLKNYYKDKKVFGFAKGGIVPKVTGIKVTKDKTLNYLSKISRTKIVDERSVGHLLKSYKPRIGKEKTFDNITKIKTGVFKNIYRESRLNEKSLEKLSKTLVSSKYLSNIAKMSRGGVIPEGYPRDTYLARLSSGERVVPPQKLDHLEPARTNIHITLDGTIKNRDLALMIRRMQDMN